MAYPMRPKRSADFRRCLYDIETDGLLPGQVADQRFAMTTIHSMVIVCLDTGRKRSFVRDDLLPLSQEDLDWLAERGHEAPEPLSVGVQVLMDADYVTGHNIVDFDNEAMEMIFPDFRLEAQVFDTLVMARMVFADIKESDFRLNARGKLEGRLIGQQGLEAWGQRLGLHKGDYKKDREAKLKELHKEEGLPPPTDVELHQFVWGTWNVEMHDYMILDGDVNRILWEKIVSFDWSIEATRMEHQIHALMVQQERNGFLFDVERGTRLAEHLRAEYDELCEKAVQQIGKWYRPAKKTVDEPTLAYGEDNSRRVWGEVTFPKRSVSMAKSNATVIETGDYTKLRADTVEGCPFVKIELREFNPNSRPQIEDRLRTLYGWEPQDFTEAGAAKVDDAILRDLAEHIPLAETLAEIFFLKKRLGQVADGKNGWLKLVRDDGRIHGRVNVGGTVSGRATHASPNVSQVPSVKAKEFKDFKEGEAYVQKWSGLLNHNGDPLLVESAWKEKKGEWKILMRGREGDFGWDCRELFTVPPRYKLVGCDLSGIEFRCLGNLTYPFDDGEIIDVVLNGDIHQRNADMAGISRSVAKRLLYACVDMETMALTKEGWKHYSDLRVGELVLTYNMERDVKEWKPIQHLHFQPGAKRVRIKGRGLDVVCTPDHRWATIRRTTVGGKPADVFEYCRTDELTTQHRIISNAPFEGDRYAWGPSFDLDAGKYGRNWTSIVMQMTSEERKAWLAGFLVADGHYRVRSSRGGNWQFTQKRGEHYEAALAAFYLTNSGRITSYLHTHGDSQTMKVELCQSRTWGCQKIEIEPIEDGDVWCMTTENSSFVMRRGDFVTITGNCMYGGGDSKLGSIVEPFSSEARQRTLGKQLRAKLMAAMPSLDKAIKEIKREKQRNRGTIAGLDGRRLYVRADHAALNLRLQSDGALIAKKWLLIIDDLFYEEGWEHGVEADYAFCSWSHDEAQIAVRDELADRAAKLMEAAAPMAGDYFNFKCPVAAEANVGLHWGETH